jgi:photosystem II stability/assembly factor-like uncharacterized protein
MWFLNSQTGWVAGQDNLVIYTSNGGINWTTIYYVPSSDRFDCLQFINNQTGFAGSYSGLIYKTTNSGYNWTSYLIHGNVKIGNLMFLNSVTGYCVNHSTEIYQGKLWKTTNTGVSWFAPGLNGGNEIFFLNINTGFVVTTNASTSYIFKTTNGGINGDLVFSSLMGNSINCIYFINSLTGFGLGGNQNIIKTTNGGNNWFLVNYNPSNTVNTNLLSGYFIDENLGYSCGYWASQFSSGHVFLKTTNGGLNWTSINVNNPPTTFTKVRIVDGQTGYIVGFDGRIYKSTNAGYVNISEQSNEIPNRFELYQNYPNPFNPVTLIKYSVSKKANVKLIIYDYLGREIAVLVNEIKQPGYYETEFNAASLPSGVYFYKISADDFNNTKKMILVK